MKLEEFINRYGIDVLMDLFECDHQLFDEYRVQYNNYIMKFRKRKLEKLMNNINDKS